MTDETGTFSNDHVLTACCRPVRVQGSRHPTLCPSPIYNCLWFCEDSWDPATWLLALEVSGREWGHPPTQLEWKEEREISLWHIVLMNHSVWFRELRPVMLQCHWEGLCSKKNIKISGESSKGIDHLNRAHCFTEGQQSCSTANTKCAANRMSPLSDTHGNKVHSTPFKKILNVCKESKISFSQKKCSPSPRFYPTMLHSPCVLVVFKKATCWHEPQLPFIILGLCCLEEWRLEGGCGGSNHHDG